MIALLAESLEFYYDLNAREGAQRRYVKCSVHGATRVYTRACISIPLARRSRQDLM